MALLRIDPEKCRISSTVSVHASSESRNQFEARDRVAVQISIEPSVGHQIAERLGEISQREGSELRTEFPEGWTVYWKIREGESRFFVAHPEVDLWVATLALSPAHFEKIIKRLQDCQSGPLSSLEPVSRMSNVEVLLQFPKGSSS